MPQKKQVDSEKGEIRLHELGKGEVHGRYKLRKGSPWVYVTFSPDGRTLCASCSIPDPVSAIVRHTCAWDVKTQRELFWLENAWQPRFLADRHTLALHRLGGASFEPGHSLIDTTNWRERVFYPGHLSEVAAAPGLQVPLLASHIPQRINPSPLAEWFRGSNVHVTPRINYNTVEIRNVETGEAIATIAHKDHFPIPFLTPDNSTLLILVSQGLNEQSILEVWDLPPRTAWEWCAAALAALTALFAGGFWLAQRRGKRTKTGTSEKEIAPFDAARIDSPL